MTAHKPRLVWRFRGGDITAVISFFLPDGSPAKDRLLLVSGRGGRASAVDEMSCLVNKAIDEFQRELAAA